MSVPVVYIAGPITKGCRILSFSRFCSAHQQMMRDGMCPINPGLTMLLPFAWDGEFDHEDWLNVCYPLVRRSDAVLRLPGKSDGATQEVAHALELGIPVFNDYEKLAKWRRDEYHGQQRRNDNGKGLSVREALRWFGIGGVSG